MLNTSSPSRPSARTALLITGFGPFPGAPVNPTATVVANLLEQGWSPERTAVHGLTVPTRWDQSAEIVAEALRASGCDGALLLGISGKAREFRVEMRAKNHADRHRPDANGVSWPQEKITPTGPAVARATAPVADMVKAIQAAGFPAAASSDAGDYLCNFTLYRILTETASDARSSAVGFLHVPRAVVRDGAEVELTIEEMETAVKAAATAFADSFTPARTRLASA